MPFLAAAAPIIGGIGGGIGAVAGALGNHQDQTYGVSAQLSGNGQAAGNQAYNAFQTYQGDVNAASPYNQNAPADLAKMLQLYAQTGGLPNQEQIGAANQYAQAQFAPQQAALNNVFDQSQVNVNRQAANLGRPVNDPVLQAKLAQYKGQQQGALSAQQGAFGAQIAMGLPQQQLGFQQALANQALTNQANVIQFGSGLLQNAQNFALGTATRNQSANSGGGLGGALLGGLEGFGGGLQTAKLLGFGGGNQGSYTTQVGQGFAGSSYAGPVAANLIPSYNAYG